VRIGILGGGQLGRMLALAARSLGLEVRIVDPDPTATAGKVAPHVAEELDGTAAREVLGACDRITWENENVSVEAVRALAERGVVRPSPQALAAAQDRWNEKRLFRDLGIPTAPFVRVDRAEDVAGAASNLGLPLVLKSRRFGYDGRGQQVVRGREELRRAHAAIGGVPAIAEAFVPFERELSVIAVRAASGEVRFWDLAENHHAEGVLRVSRAPAPGASPELVDAARDAIRRLLEHLGYVGVLALELFEVEGRLLANEMAPRVHNSGHWTLEGARTSQFENHLRAVADLPLGDTSATSASAMVNCLGELPPAAEVESLGAVLHDYAKTPRTRRKVGHMTVLGRDHAALASAVAELCRLAGHPWDEGSSGAPGPSSRRAPASP